MPGPGSGSRLLSSSASLKFEETDKMSDENNQLLKYIADRISIPKAVQLAIAIEYLRTTKFETEIQPHTESAIRNAFNYADKFVAIAFPNKREQ